MTKENQKKQESKAVPSKVYQRGELAVMKTEILNQVARDLGVSTDGGKTKIINSILGKQAKENPEAVKAESVLSVKADEGAKAEADVKQAPKEEKPKEEKKEPVPVESVQSFVKRLKEALSKGVRVYVDSGKGTQKEVTNVEYHEKVHYRTGEPVEGVVINKKAEDITPQEKMYYQSCMHRYLKIEEPSRIDEPVLEEAKA